MTDTTPKDQKPTKSSKREYVVLENVSEGEGGSKPSPNWRCIGKVHTQSESQAKRIVINGIPPRDYGPLVAIPARSWNPTTPKVTAQTVLKIEGV